MLFQLRNRGGVVIPQRDLLTGQQLIGGFGEPGLGFRRPHGSHAGQGHALTQGAFIQTFETQDQGGALVHQQQPAAQQVTHRAQLAVVEMTGGQEVQTQQFRQKVGVRDIVRVLLTAVGLHAGRVGQDNVIAVIL